MSSQNQVSIINTDDLQYTMGCGASSLNASNEHRDDLAPKPHTQQEVNKTSSGFSHSNHSAGVGPRGDDYGGANDTRYSESGGGAETGEDDLKKPPQQKTRKELIAEAKARRAGGWRNDGQQLQIGMMGIS